jgi:glucose-fructose oxidoreductase
LVIGIEFSNNDRWTRLGQTVGSPPIYFKSPPPRNLFFPTVPSNQYSHHCDGTPFSLTPEGEFMNAQGNSGNSPPQLPIRFVGLNFDHMHMGDNLRMVLEQPGCELVGICDLQPERMEEAISRLGISRDKVFTSPEKCLEACRADIAILCPASAEHGDWVARVAPYVRAILIEKPFAASLAEADRMIEVCRQHNTLLAINWPLVWVASHQTAKYLVDSGRIGQLKQVHYYNGNRGPLWHTAEKIERTVEWVEKEKPHSWFYSAQRGGGSLLDYLGYGTTLGTWYFGGAKPLEVTATTDSPEGLSVDEHSITVARYPWGLSKFETRWGTFTDPWVSQPQPKCGFVLVGSHGTISSYDYENKLTLQTAEQPFATEIPVRPLHAPYRNPIEYIAHVLCTGEPLSGPLSPEISRIGQQIVDTAFQSALQKRTLPLLDCVTR